jgi:lysophospholipase L1-like esterase
MKTAAWLGVLALLQAVPEAAWEPAPRQREYPWMSVAAWKGMHEQFLKRAKEGKVDVLFLGDSITQGWGGNAVWQKHYAPLQAANFGIGGDTTQNVLWRITNGELEGIAPKVVVLMIGTNNFGLHGDGPEAVVKGIAAVVAALRKKLPASRILLLGIFPRDEKPNTDARRKIQKVNSEIAKLEDRKAVRFLDLGARFLSADGSIAKDVMPDFLHLSEKGYQIWADGMDPLLKELVR